MVFPYKCAGLTLLIVIVVVCAGCTQPAQPVPKISTGYSDITAEEARSLKHASDGKLVIIDLSPNYTEGHLPMATSIPLDSLDDKILALDKSRPYLVYGHSDDSSITGAIKLVNAGFSPVYRLKGNYQSWVSAGYPGE